MRNKAIFLLLGLIIGSGCDRCDEDPNTNVGDDDDDSTTMIVEGDDDDETAGTLPPLPTPTPVQDPVTSIELWPSSAEIDVDSTLSYVADARLLSGKKTDVAVELWESQDPLVATIDETGTVHPVGEGTTYISASIGDVTSAAVPLEVIPVGKLEVQVVDADTREPVPEAEVYLGIEAPTTYTADSEGKVTIEVDDGSLAGPQTVSAYHPDYFHATIFGVKSRRLTVPLRKESVLEQGSFSGDTNFDDMGDLSNKDIRIGLITRSFYGNPLSLDTATIIGTYRKVDICGYDMSLPSNIVGLAYCADVTDFIVPGPSGIFDAYMLAGDLSLKTLFDWLADDPDIFENLGLMLMNIPNMYDFSYEYLQDISIVAPDDTPDLVSAPAGLTNVPMTVNVPAMPSGIVADYPPAIFAIVDMGERGFLPIGVAGAVGGMPGTVYYPDEFSERPLYAMILASEQGVGHEGAYAAVMGEQTSRLEAIDTPPFLELIQPSDFSVEEETYSFYPVADTSVYRTVFSFRFKDPAMGSNKKTLLWDMYQPADQTTTVIPALPTAPEILYADWTLDRIDWEFFSYDDGDLTFDIFVTDGNLNILDSSLLLERISRNKLYNVASY